MNGENNNQNNLYNRNYRNRYKTSKLHRKHRKNLQSNLNVTFYNYFLYKACLRGTLSRIKTLSKRSKTLNWNYGLVGACQGNHTEIVQLSIRNDATWNKALIIACQKGYIEIIQLIIDNGAKHLNYGLTSACEGGYMDIVKLLINNGANGYDWGLKSACEKNHKEIALFMITKGADINNYILNLNFEDIYYLKENGILTFGKFDEKIPEILEEWNTEFKNVINEIFITDVANMITAF